MTDLAKLVVRMEANTAKYQRELQKANKRALNWQRTTTRAVRAVTRVFFTLAGVAGVAGLGGLINGLITADDKMAKLATRLGSTAGAFSELQHVAQLSGVTFETLNMGLQRMERRIAEAANGTGEAVKALAELNLNAKVLRSLSLDTQFEIVAESLSKVTNDADRVRLAMKLFDSEGVALIQTMKGGARGIQDMRAEARKLGLTLSNEQAAAAEKAKDEMARLNAAIKGMVQSMVRHYTPAVANFAEALNNLINPTARSAADVEREIASLKDLIDATIEQANKPGGLFPDLTKGNALKALDEYNRMLVALDLELAGLEAAGARIEANFLQELDLVKLLEPGIEKTEALRKDFDKFIESILKAQQLEEIDLFPKGFAGLEETEAERIRRDWDQFIARQIDQANELNSGWEDLGLTFQSAFENAIIEGEKLRDVMQALLKDILRIYLRQTVTQPLADALGSAFGGARASGGPVASGRTYVVGEKGPELFTPSVSGRIIPGMASAGPNINYTIDARGADEQRIVQTVVPLLQRTVEFTKAALRKDKSEGRF